MGNEPAWCASRRMLLTGIGGLGVAGLLTACGDDTPHSNAANAGVPASTSGAAAPAALADAGDVPVGGGTVVGGVLIVQPAAGTFKAYDAACPHKGILVGPPKDGIATCPAHNSTFDITDGARVSGPATKGLTEIAVTVTAGKIVLDANPVLSR